jgi:predicted nuclease of restriction endonuclease-like RecB superfamily
MNLSKEIRPDFVIDDQKGNIIILEHFGMDNEDYLKKRKEKEEEYKKLCQESSTFFFVSTDEDDIYNLKDRLGKKLNETPIKKVIWK